MIGFFDVDMHGLRGNTIRNLRLEVSDRDSEYHSIIVDVAMGSFADLPTEDALSHHFPFHQELLGRGDATAHLQMAMCRIEIAKEN